MPSVQTVFLCHYCFERFSGGNRFATPMKTIRVIAANNAQATITAAVLAADPAPAGYSISLLDIQNLAPGTWA
jgi:hypothetical protein